jgi:vacuolar-type H+-ATPase subunit I/STV1
MQIEAGDTVNTTIITLCTACSYGGLKKLQPTGAENMAHIFAHSSIVTMAMGNISTKVY